LLVVHIRIPTNKGIEFGEVLGKLGFSCCLLGCEDYLFNRLACLSGEDVEKIKQAFVENCHPRFVKCFGGRLAFGNREAYAEEVRRAGVEKLVKLIKVCGVLMQTKVYLFWDKCENYREKDGKF